MGQKRKLQQFAEIKTFENVLEVGFEEVYNRRHPLSGKWQTEIFGNTNPLIIELGCGKGEYTVGMARKYPNRNFIGVDIKGARMWRGAKSALEEGLKNVYFLRTRIEFIDSFFDKGEVDQIWVTFPDPQPRESREKKRLTSPNFIDRYKKVLKPNGIVHLKTDSRFLYDYTLEILPETELKMLCSSSNLYKEMEGLSLTDDEKEILSIPTHYEKLFSDKGHLICYLKTQYG